MIVGTDVHNSPGGEGAGVVAPDAASGGRRWTATTAPLPAAGSRGATGPGCADVWGSPSVDLDRRLVFVGTGNCTTADGWGPNSEALLALDLDSGRTEWTYQPCVASPCPLGFDLTTDRVGGDVGSGTVHIEASPFRVTVSADGLGEPSRWLRPGSTAASVGARRYGVYLSQGTDNPVGGLVCVLDDDFDCTGTENPLPGAAYDRVRILAVDEPGELPSITEGFDRMVATNSIAVPFAPS